MAIVYPVESARAALSARPRGNIDRAYRAASRHSRLVHLLRLGIPAGIGAVLFGVILVNFMPPVGGFRLPADLGKLVIAGSKITMQQPRLAGFTSDARAYVLTAQTAAQDVTRPNFLELREPRAKVEMADKSTVAMSARVGTYDVKTEKLTLEDHIHLMSSTGYEGDLSHAVIDVRKGGVVSDAPVVIKLLNGFLQAKRLEVTDNGAVVRFDGGVTMTLHPDGDLAKAGRP